MQRDLNSLRGAMRFLWVVAALVVELRGAGIAVAGGLLHFLQRGAIFERRSGERGAHRVRRIPPVQSDRGGVLPQNPVNGFRVHGTARFLHLTISGYFWSVAS
jgi:hypothetical protein